MGSTSREPNATSQQSAKKATGQSAAINLQYACARGRFSQARPISFSPSLHRVQHTDCRKPQHCQIMQWCKRSVF